MSAKKEVDISEEELNELLKDDLDDTDIVEDPKDVVDTPELSQEELDKFLEMTKNMDRNEMNELISKLSRDNNINPEDLHFDPMSKKNYLKKKLNDKIKNKQLGRLTKTAKTNRVKEMMKKHEESKKEEEDKEEDKEENTDKEDSEPSAKTLKNRKKRQRQREKLKLLKQQLAENTDSPVNADKNTDTNSDAVSSS